MLMIRFGLFPGLFVLLAVFSFLTPSVAAEQPLRVVVNAPYPPFAEIDSKGNLHGFDVDIAHALCKELGRECSILSMDFEEIIPAIRDGRVDFAVAGMGASEERKALVAFTDRYYRSVSIFIERKGTIKEVTPETIQGLRVGVQAATLQAEYLADVYGASITVIADISYETVMDRLKKGEVDLVLSDGLPGYAYLASEKGADLEVIGTPVEPGGALDWACITLAKDRDDLCTALNQAIQQLRRSGEYDRINRKYFEFSVY